MCYRKSWFFELLLTTVIIECYMYNHPEDYMPGHRMDLSLLQVFIRTIRTLLLTSIDDKRCLMPNKPGNSIWSAVCRMISSQLPKNDRAKDVKKRLARSRRAALRKKIKIISRSHQDLAVQNAILRRALQHKKRKLRLSTEEISKLKVNLKKRQVQRA